MLNASLGIRVDERNPNHHLYLNNGTWFIHYTVHPTPVTKERVRRSLRTKCPAEARRRRDEVLAGLLRPDESPRQRQGGKDA